MKKFGHCDGLIIHAGINHLLRGREITAEAEEIVEQEIQETMRRIEDSFGTEGIKIWCGLIPTHRKPAEWNARLMKLNNSIKDICKQHNWGYAHPHGFLTNGQTSQENYTDDLHLGWPGRNLHARNITNAISHQSNQEN